MLTWSTMRGTPFQVWACGYYGRVNGNGCIYETKLILVRNCSLEVKVFVGKKVSRAPGLMPQST